MSTRCQIGIYSEKPSDLKNFDVLLYRHSDGDPDSIIEDILDFLKEFKENRGLDDTEYLSAWLITHLINLSSQSDFLGYGICKNFHYDLSYFYVIYPNQIEVYQANGSDNPNRFTLINQIEI